MPLKLHQDDVPAINLTPMIDIVFQLIIFFMVGARFSELENKIDLQVPQVNSNSVLPQTTEKFVINIHREGRITLNKLDITPAVLTTQLATVREQRGTLRVTIRQDEECPGKHLAAVLAACRDAGVEDFDFSIRVAGKVR